MNFNNISFPHPVLGIGDSIQSEIINWEPQMQTEEKTYKISFDIKHDNDELKKLVEEGKAVFFCEINCTNTCYRKSFRFQNSKFELEILRNDVRGTVEISCLLLTNTIVNHYYNTAFHPDYNEICFDLDEGEVLAFFGEISFNADIKYEKLKAVSSFMEVVQNEEDAEYTEIDLDGHRILIKLPPEDYESFSNTTISKNSEFVPVIHSSIVLNALLAGLYNYETYLTQNKLWALTLKERLKSEEFRGINIEDKENIVKIAQILLGNPVNRLLCGLELINEDL